MSIKISELPQATSVGSSDIVPIVQGGTTKQATAGMIAPNNLSLLSVSSSEQNFSISQSGSANSVKIVATSTALSYGSGFSVNNGNIKIDNEPKLVQFFVEVNPYAIGIDTAKTMSITVRRSRNGTITNIGGGEKSRYGGVMKWSFTAIDEAQVGDEYWCAVVNGTSGSTLSCTIGATAKFFTVKKLADTATRSLNLMRGENTGSLVGFGDKAEVTDEVIEEKKEEAKTDVAEETEKEGSGDER